LNVHALFWQTGCACSTFVVQACPQVMQLVVFCVVSTQVPLHSVGAEPGQPVAQAYVVPEPEHTGLDAGHFMPQEPQLSVFEMSTSQPSSGFVEQWV
jgi:hypothetical protein